ncbi:type IV secretory system conjugative DNA transfer family protein [Ruminococcaceae bacterium OttesenSCG-928-O06]|nr:type IV secretory system conjugative DNA transfer family protein [Ruminococcaceae bacterium OttesenSCG-928-O06]
MGKEDYKFTKFYRQRQETRWADAEEVKAITGKVELAQGSYGAAGLPVLNNGAEAWVDGSDTHSLIFGATGSKKTRLFCMPMLHIMAGAGESFVATDPKGELYRRTSGFAAARGYRVVVLNYRDLRVGDTWNPLALPYKMYQNGDREGAVSALGDFVNAISEKQMETTNDIFWVNAARSVALSILILMLDVCTEEECNLQTFTRFCVEFAKGTSEDAFAKATGYYDEDKAEKNYLNELMELAPPESIARLNYDGIAGSSDRARGDVQSTLFTLVGVFMTQEMLVRNMSQNSFDLERIGHEKTAVYLIVPDEKTTFHFIATTFIKQCYETLIAQAQAQPDFQLPVRVNFVLDEFANIPAIPDMPAMITAARSRNMRFYLVVQSMHQLRKKYEDEAQTIKGNCENWVFLSSKEIELLTEISKLCGNVRSTEEDSREWPLISISQLQRLNKQRGEALIFCGRQYPFITELADIDDCRFEACESVPFKRVRIGQVHSIGPRALFTEIKRKQRHMPFKT